MRNAGYGKYCGAEYTYGFHPLPRLVNLSAISPVRRCLAGDPGCDALDACCRTHDYCVDAAGGYCDTCLCNLALAQCAGAASGPGFCGKLEEARAAVLDDICFVLRYAPHWCGGCTTNATLPAACQNYTLSW